jgi:predicted DsbA family dithiol-disulfide isomerase
VRAKLSGVSFMSGVGFWRPSWTRLLVGIGILVGGGVAPVHGGSSEVLAVVDARPITEADIEAEAGALLFRARTAHYQARREAAEAVVGRLLLEKEAQRRGVTRAQLDAEIIGPSLAIEPEELARFYEARKAAIGRPFEEVRAQLEEHVRRERVLTTRAQALERLKKATRITWLLTPPTIAVTGTGFSKGSATAPVTIVEFSDFQCVFCRRAQTVLGELLARYGDDVRLVHRDFPSPRHPMARAAAEAARCAGDQGKFWEYHDMLFQGQPTLTEGDLGRLSREVGLEAEPFTTCLTSGRHRDAIDADLREGKRSFVEGTPTFFVNGRPVIGAPPLDVFIGVIEEELERVR